MGEVRRGIAINYDRPTRPHLSSRPSAEGDLLQNPRSREMNQRQEIIDEKYEEYIILCF